MNRIAALTAFVASLALCAPIALADEPAHIGVRAGLETPFYTHYSRGGASGSYWLGDSFQPALDLLVEYYPGGMVSIGAELREGFASTGSLYDRTGTAIGPSVTFDFTPLYLRLALPVHVEPSPAYLDFRPAGGLKLGSDRVAFYVEAALDFPLVGGSGVGIFDTQQVSLGAGVWLKF